jgi:hypothetical protein
VKIFSFLVISLLLLVGCSSSKANEQGGNENSAVTIDEKPVGVSFSSADPDFFERLQRGGMTTKEHHKKIREDIHICMREKGWEFESKIPVRPESDKDLGKPTLPPSTESWYGYASKALQNYKSAGSADSRGEIPPVFTDIPYGADYSATLDPATSQKFMNDLLAAGTGCIIIAESKSQLRSGAGNLYIRRVNEKMVKAIHADKDMNNAAKLWSGCMGRAALEYPEREKVRDHFSSRASAILMSERSVVEGQLAVLLEEEKVVAAADLKCSAETSYDVVVQETYKKYGLIAAEELGYLR